MCSTPTHNAHLQNLSRERRLKFSQMRIRRGSGLSLGRALEGHLWKSPQGLGFLLFTGLNGLKCTTKENHAQGWHRRLPGGRRHCELPQQLAAASLLDEPGARVLTTTGARPLDFRV